MKATTKIAAGFAAASLAFSPIAAQAGMRAASSPVSVETARVAAEDDDRRDRAVRILALPLLLSLLAAIAALIAAGSGGRTRGG